MWASILICAALTVLLALAVWGIVRRRKKKRGKCEDCAGFCSGLNSDYQICALDKTRKFA